MKISDALAVLQVESPANLETITKAYRRLAMAYHPDRNPTFAAGQAMRLINTSRDVLMHALEDCPTLDEVPAEANIDYASALYSAVAAVDMLHGINLELCGAWLWITGETYPHKDVLKGAGFLWSKNKSAWYFRPAVEVKTFRRGSFSLDKIREVHGSSAVRPIARVAG